MEQGTIGGVLARWRSTRRMSQLDLALEAGVSSKHLSFIETGRSRPSREMVLTLCRALKVPLRERNGMLLAAGYAPVYRETALDAPQMAQVRAALRLILQRHDPFPAVVFDRNWDIVMANAGYARFVNDSLAEGQEPLRPLEVTSPPRLNMLRLLVSAAGYRQRIANWETVTRAVLARVRWEVAGDRSPARQELVREISTHPDVPAERPEVDVELAQDLIIPVELRFGETIVRLLSTIATLGTAQDITLQELRIESFHPADEEADRFVREQAR